MSTCARSLQAKLAEHQVLLDRIPVVPDLKSAWVLLSYCATARANYALRVVRPELTDHFAIGHDDAIWQCFGRILGDEVVAGGPETRGLATLPQRLGGLGLRSAERLRAAAHWASWADCIGMVKARHPALASTIVAAMAAPDGIPAFEAVGECVAVLGAEGFHPPRWEDLADGVRPEASVRERAEPSETRHGWQREVAVVLDTKFSDTMRRGLPDPRVALVCS